ncbi:MAG: hypothetical protein U0350_24010 [Caldilineaceae bacterium]
MSNEDLLYINGVDAVTGDYLFPPISLAELAARIKDTPVAPQEAQARAFAEQQTIACAKGLDDDVAPTDVKHAGWAVVFHKDEEPAVKKEVMRLYEHRRQQLQNDACVKVLEYADEAECSQWLEKYQVAAGNVYPWRVPYYLLLVGGPQRIPFDFCQMLSMEYATGLLHFADAAAYARYVDSVIAYETGDAPPRQKAAVFFRTNRDPTTTLSAEHLVKPLADGLPAAGDEPARPAVAASKGFATHRLWDVDATAAKLAEVFAPPATTPPPAFLFSATHGVGFIQPTPGKQLALQGALKCQDDTPFSAALLANIEHVQVHGLIAFLFACYSAGTPQFDQYVTRTDRKPLQIADQPFLAALPKALLSHPQGGALACIGHVERAWNYSFNTTKLGDQLIPYQNAVRRILGGLPVGYALTDMRQRYMSLAASVGRRLENSQLSNTPLEDQQLVTDWAARNDAGGYIVFGDPAVCLRLEGLVESDE